MSEQRLAGKVALITGAGGAIGGAIARHFASHGAKICVGDINLEGAEQTVSDIGAGGGTAVACPLDVSDAAQAERAVQLAVEKFGNLHILINVAAGSSPDATVVDRSLEDWTREISINLTGCFLMSKYAIPAMKDSGGGAIINIASQYGQIGAPLRSGYCASKGGILQLTKVMAIDHADDNIRVNSISPGAIDTPRSLHRYGTPENANKIRGRFYLARRTGTVLEVAEGALYLASDAASFCTGTDLLIDGGFMAFKGTTDDLPKRD
ncbi:MAG: glucose 1-dehydrogenase [Rhodospirillales bacterium]|jgi:NAD(P)-dependent dehydrogenase (short-subunit alcohol dehydrogenase family)|nr:glucose 1-dehydrogenase [Rhodospirillales bacterium]MBT5077046.1 glucose 1-dehydrogenase [Rhodospirillales bacterium]MBT5113987.1 glucose 1-dehydrogenase [Rhodospirillales bacterium]MBT5672515.1 glucose 1-dehydrogenase [Rhodospirillales bacterium]MBT6185816.1 glucose 1-dehydrogenase [Rhodospirillales bacterium]